jgi:hypothetical protein
MYINVRDGDTRCKEVKLKRKRFGTELHRPLYVSFDIQKAVKLDAKVLKGGLVSNEILRATGSLVTFWNSNQIL